MQDSLSVEPVNYHNPVDQQALLSMLDMYAQDPMGGGAPLPLDTHQRLCADLSQFTGAISWLAWINGQPVGLLNALPGYSTFKARPLLNVHDIAVHPAFRGRGVGQALLAAMQVHARAIGCCKITLEVLSGNEQAQRVYERFGFEQYSLSEESGHALFMQKWL